MIIYWKAPFVMLALSALIKMNSYSSLNKQIFTKGDYSIVPIRFEDRLDIMKWRNEQIYHLRQAKPLSEENQNAYFQNVVSKLFEQEQPNQLLFSFLKNDTCIGYGGLVHINWIDQHAEISFIMDTTFEKSSFELMWSIYLELIEEVAYDDLNLHKLYTYAFDIRPHLYTVLEENGYNQEADLKEHCFINGEFKSVFIHTKTKNKFYLKKVNIQDLNQTLSWAENPIIRQFSFNKSLINKEDHTNWFNNKIEDGNCYFFIAKEGSKKIGSIRFDNSNHSAIVSYLIDPKYFGKGYGSKLLKIGEQKINRIHEVKEIIGYVIPENIGSVRIFKKLSYHDELETQDKIKFTKKLHHENN